MPFSAKQIAIAAAIIGLFLTGLTTGWAIQGWRLNATISSLKADHANEMKAISDAAAEAALEAQRKQAAWQDALAALDQKHFRELSDANSKIDLLRTELDDGSKRVFIDAQCPADPGRGGQAPKSARVGDGTPRAELNPKVARSLVGIASDGDKAIRKLNALQDYIQQVCTN